MKWYYDLKIGTKLLSAFVLIALIAGTVGYVGITSIKKIEEADTIMYEKMAVPLGQLARITDDFQQIRIILRLIFDSHFFLIPYSCGVAC